MSLNDSETEGDPKVLVGQITDDPDAVKSLTDAILPALLEGLSRQNVRLANNGSMHNLSNSETQMGNQAANFRPDGGSTIGHGSISGNEAGQSLGSGNQARIGNGPGNEANAMMGNSGNLWTMAHGGGSFVAPMNLPRFPGYYPGVQFPAAATQGHPSWYNPGPLPPFQPPNPFLWESIKPPQYPSRKRAREPASPSSHSLSQISEEEEGEEEDAINPHVLERERSELLSDSDSDLGSEDEDLKVPDAKKRFMSSEEVQQLLNSTSLKPLKNDRRKSIINKLPIPACDPAYPPKLDEAVSTLIPKSAKSHDKFLSKLQRYTLDAMGPLVWMLDQFQQGNEIDPKVGKGAIKSSLNLLGNASAHFNVERRKAIMKHLNKDLKPMPR